MASQRRCNPPPIYPTNEKESGRRSLRGIVRIPGGVRCKTAQKNLPAFPGEFFCTSFRRERCPQRSAVQIDGSQKPWKKIKRKIRTNSRHPLSGEWTREKGVIGLTIGSFLLTLSPSFGTPGAAFPTVVFFHLLCSRTSFRFASATNNLYKASICITNVGFQ